MALNKKEARTWRALQLRLSKVEKASRRREKALERIAEKMGVEIDLTRLPTAEQDYAADLAGKSSKHLLDSEEVRAYLRESEEEDAEEDNDRY